LSAVFLLFGIPNDNVHIIIAGSVAYAIHNQCLAGLMPALLAEMTTPGEQRMRAMSHLQTANSAGNASGPALQLLLMLLLQTDQWTLSQLHWVLCSGLVFFPIYTVLICRIPDAGEAAAVPTVAQISTPESPLPAMHRSRRHWVVAVIIEMSSLVTAIGSGMTFKFWPLFFKGDFGFSPSGVCAMQLAIWGSISVAVQMSPRLAKKIGRAPAILFLHSLGVLLLFSISLTTFPVAFTVVLVIVRNAVMNSASPLLQSMIMDIVPQKHRGKWSSIQSLRRMTWSGSAFLGGLLSDSHDYRYAFFITACFHSFAALGLVVVAVIAP